VKSINPRLDKILKPQELDVKEASYYIEGIIESKNFLVLAEAVTLLESENAEHKRIAHQILMACEKNTCQSKRIGVTGSPGVGKSTFIESITPSLISAEAKAAVLTIDPSSIDNRGSILGDKTRMDQLTKDRRIFVRPSPSRTFLGGTHAMTYEAVVMCEAAGIETIIIETVGVGQSEYAVGDIVDCTILLLLPGSGDDLQGIKKGITQIADIIVINKSDGDRLPMARRVAQDYEAAAHIIQTDNKAWSIPVCLHSSIDPMFNMEVIDHITKFFDHYNANDIKTNHRNNIQQKVIQSRLEYHLQEELKKEISKNDNIQKLLKSTSNLPFATIDSLLKDINLDLSCG